MSEEKVKIYLAGAARNCTAFDEKNKWRVKISDILEPWASLHGYYIKFINPIDYYNFRQKRKLNEMEVMQYNINQVRSSDIIIVNLLGINSSIETCIELYEAYRKNIPVIAVDLNKDYENVHPWVKKCITRVEDTCVEASEYIRYFYMT